MQSYHKMHVSKNFDFNMQPNMNNMNNTNNINTNKPVIDKNEAVENHKSFENRKLLCLSEEKLKTANMCIIIASVDKN